MNAATTIDLDTFSDKELEDLLPKIEKELEARREKRKKEALEKMREVAKTVGMTPEELLGLSVGGGRRRRGGGRRGRIEWRHPDNPELIYRGGKKPNWVKELTDAAREPVKVEG